MAQNFLRVVSTDGKVIAMPAKSVVKAIAQLKGGMWIANVNAACLLQAPQAFVALR